jgi:cellulose synthase/poly-beta-1,6-N-acetylglucosamine synthase-like glycosyltransferase
METSAIALVTPSLNQGATLARTIESVLAQRYPALEYCMLDAGSTDESGGIIRRYAKEFSYWRSAPDGGQVQALNEGFRRTRAPLCGWVNADDFLMPGALAAVAEVFAREPEVDMVFGDAHYLRADGSLLLRIVPRCVQADTLRLACHVHQPSVFFRRRALENAGYLDESLKNVFDYDLWLNIARCGKMRYLPRMLSGSLVSMECKTFRGWGVTLEETMRVQRKHWGLASWETHWYMAAWRACGYIPHFNQCRTRLHVSARARAAFLAEALMHPKAWCAHERARAALRAYCRKNFFTIWQDP